MRNFALLLICSFHLCVYGTDIVRIVFLETDEDGIKPNPKSHRMVVANFEVADKEIDTTDDEIPSNMIDCKMYGDRKVMDMVMKDFHDKQKYWLLTPIKMSKVVNLCNQVSLENLKQMDAMGPGGIFDGLLTFPGTKWCGPGDVADSIADLGTSWKADLCCREHDFCPLLMHSGESMYGLKNSAIHTKVHCDCDSQFRSCLRMVNDDISNRIGSIFFNTIMVQCFKKEKPIVKCLEWNGLFFYRSCQKYELNMNGTKMWQFFDAIKY